MNYPALDFSNFKSDFLAFIQDYLPRIIAALLLILLGWFIARLLKKLAFHIVTRINRWGNLKAGLQDIKDSDMTPKAVSAIIFWVTFLLFLVLACQVFGLPVVSGSLNRISAYLPSLLAAVLVVLAGIVLGNLARTVVSSILHGFKISQSALLGEVARISVVGIAVVIALSQAGIDSTVLVLAFGLGFGGTIGGMALAFGFGARTAVSNLIAGRNISRNLSSGSLVRVGETQGRVLEITPSAVIISTAEGRAQIPARLFEESVTVLIEEKE
ncbi:MAG: mechanosensitive ion channel [Acidobacteriota bacterium]